MRHRASPPGSEFFAIGAVNAAQAMEPAATAGTRLMAPPRRTVEVYFFVESRRGGMRGP